VFKSRVLRKIRGPKGDEVTREWRRLHNEELYGWYSTLNIFRVIKWGRMRWVGHVARMGNNRSAYRVLVRRPEGKRKLEYLGIDGDNIKMDFQEVGCAAMDWIILV
jgi:hypothetical protein